VNLFSRNAAAACSGLLLLASACSSPPPEAKQASVSRVPGAVFTVHDTSLEATFEASGIASPLRQATLGTKLIGTVLEVFVKEGDAVGAGQPLVRIDARDLTAKQAQAAASIADAEAMHRDAVTQAGRIRGLYADSAATRAQLDAAETGLSRADAGLRASRAAAEELRAVSSYALVRAPFAGVVTKRFVDPGAFAAPGAPLVSVQDGHQLRITVNATPDAARGVRRGQSVAAKIEGRPVTAVVEGVVPAASGNLYAINALVANPGGSILPGSTATLLLPAGMHTGLVVPAGAVTRQGDLTGVIVRTTEGDEMRWVRVGQSLGTMIEVNAGLRAGEQVVVPPPGEPPVAGRE
jgi:RND family efflux transporter MFP subunit